MFGVNFLKSLQAPQISRLLSSSYVSSNSIRSAEAAFRKDLLPENNLIHVVRFFNSVFSNSFHFVVLNSSSLGHFVSKAGGGGKSVPDQGFKLINLILVLSKKCFKSVRLDLGFFREFTGKPFNLRKCRILQEFDKFFMPFKTYLQFPDDFFLLQHGFITGDSSDQLLCVFQQDHAAGDENFQRLCGRSFQNPEQCRKISIFCFRSCFYETRKLFGNSGSFVFSSRGGLLMRIFLSQLCAYIFSKPGDRLL